MRDEINFFIREQEEKTIKMKQEFSEQVETVRRKMVVQQSTAQNQGEGFFRRTRNTLNSSGASTTSVADRKESHHEVAALRKEMEMLRDEIRRGEGMG
jgi:uncharacterized protein (DUF849 family)